MVSTIEWFHEMPNGTSKKIKTARTGDPHTHTIGKVMPYSFTFVLLLQYFHKNLFLSSVELLANYMLFLVLDNIIYIYFNAIASNIMNQQINKDS